jgi:hypothetical protein
MHKKHIARPAAIIFALFRFMNIPDAFLRKQNVKKAYYYIYYNMISTAKKYRAVLPVPGMKKPAT